MLCEHIVLQMTLIVFTPLACYLKQMLEHFGSIATLLIQRLLLLILANVVIETRQVLEAVEEQNEKWSNA
jgi:hypothetical protein